MSTKLCKIHYRKLRRENGIFPTQTLSSKISEALDQKKNGVAIGADVLLRVADVPRGEGYRRLFNDTYKTADLVFGDICLFSPGQMQSLLRLTSSDEQPTLAEVMSALEIEERKAPEGREYLHAIAYWLAIGDHFYLIQHIALQSKALEEYLTWLLRDQAKVISKDHCVILDSSFDRSQVGDDLGDISSIEVGGFVPETVYEDVSKSRKDIQSTEIETVEEVAPKTVAKWDKAKRILIALFGEIETAKLIKEIPSQASLEVTVNIGRCQQFVLARGLEASSSLSASR